MTLLQNLRQGGARIGWEQLEGNEVKNDDEEKSNKPPDNLITTAMEQKNKNYVELFFVFPFLDMVRFEILPGYLNVSTFAGHINRKGCNIGAIGG